jgi:DNA-binding MarR family transcriptional regulator
VKVSTVDPSRLDLPVLAALAGASVDELLLARLRAAGHPRIRRSHGYIFQRLLAEAPTITELGVALRITQQAASKAVIELEALGYVERRPDAADSRLRRIGLTESGRAVIEIGRRLRSEFEAEVLASLNPAEAEAGRRLLLALLAASGGLDAIARRRVPLPSD